MQIWIQIQVFFHIVCPHLPLKGLGRGRGLTLIYERNNCSACVQLSSILLHTAASGGVSCLVPGRPAVGRRREDTGNSNCQPSGHKSVSLIAKIVACPFAFSKCVRVCVYSHVDQFRLAAHRHLLVPDQAEPLDHEPIHERVIFTL